MFFYRLFIGLYAFMVHFLALWQPKAKKFIEGRKNWREQVAQSCKSISQPIWIHAASLGEFEQGRPVIESIRKTLPNYSIILTFFSPSGYEIRQKYDKVDAVFYLPLDTPKNARDFIFLTKPKIALFIKYEFWLHFIEACHEFNVPFWSISTVIRKNHWISSFFGKFSIPFIQKIDRFFVQDLSTAQFLQSITKSNIVISGDTRFDRVTEIANQPFKDEYLDAFCSKPVVVCGSIWPDDMPLLQYLIEKSISQWKWILVPHDVSPVNIKIIENSISIPCTKYLQQFDNESDILIIDTIGLLSSVYRYGSIAYIGGAFHGGLHNTLEPAAYGIPLFFGNHKRNSKFLEVKQLLDNQAALDVGNFEEEWEKLYQKLFKNESLRNEMGKNAKNLVYKNIGATDLIMENLIKQLS